MDAPKYEVFDLRLTRLADGRAEVALLEGPAGNGGSHAFEVPHFAPELLHGLAIDPCDSRGATPRSPVESPRRSEVECAREIGTVLFRALLGGSLADRFHKSRAIVEGRGSRLRLKLRLPADGPELARLPWEYLFDPGEGDFLAFEPALSLVRFLEGAGRGPSPLRVALPLRVLAVHSSPDDYPPLDGERELRHLREALGKLGGSLKLEVLEKASGAALRARLKRGGVHVLHFIGHGEVSPSGEGCLILAGEHGEAERLGSLKLKTLLKEAEGLRLVVLNCCQGGSTLPTDPRAGLAQTLLRAGVPAVIAMQSQVSDEAAITFAARFYQGLAASGSVERAVTEARLALYLEDSNDAEWGSPVLFLRVEDGQLFRPPGRRWPYLLGGVVVAGGLALAAWSGLFGPAEEEAPVATPPANRKLPDLLASDQECPSPSGVRLAYLQAGEFQMGEGRNKRQVRISKPFCLGRYEITVGEWATVMGDGSRGLLATGDRRPIAGVTWDEVNLWVERLNAQNPGMRCWLPTEAQWEYGARAGSAAAYSFGDDPADLRSFANCDGGKDGYDGELAPVGAFEPNRWKICDAQGNVSEWTADWYAKELPRGPLVDPTGPTSGKEKVRRGGGYDTVPKNCRIAHRTSGQPDRKWSEAGFRIACEPLADQKP